MAYNTYDNLRLPDGEYLKSEESIGTFLGIANTSINSWEFAISLGLL